MYSKLNILLTLKKHRKFAKDAINKYQNALKLIKNEENLWDIHEILEVNNCCYGVCKLMWSHKYFNNQEVQDLIELYKKCDSWGDINPFSNTFWFKTPSHATSKEEVINLIYKRIKVLKEWL